MWHAQICRTVLVNCLTCTGKLPRHTTSPCCASLCESGDWVAQQGLEQRLHEGRHGPAVRRSHHQPARKANTGGLYCIVLLINQQLFSSCPLPCMLSQRSMAGLVDVVVNPCQGGGGRMSIVAQPHGVQHNGDGAVIKLRRVGQLEQGCSGRHNGVEAGHEQPACRWRHLRTAAEPMLPT